MDATKKCLLDVFHRVKWNRSLEPDPSENIADVQLEKIGYFQPENLGGFYLEADRHFKWPVLYDELQQPCLHHMCAWSEITIYSLISPSILPPVIVSPHSVIRVQFRSFGLFKLHFCRHQKGSSRSVSAFGHLKKKHSLFPSDEHSNGPILGSCLLAWYNIYNNNSSLCKIQLLSQRIKNT